MEFIFASDSFLLINRSSVAPVFLPSPILPTRDVIKLRWAVLELWLSRACSLKLSFSYTFWVCKVLFEACGNFCPLNLFTSDSMQKESNILHIPKFHKRILASTWAMTDTERELGGGGFELNEARVSVIVGTVKLSQAGNWSSQPDSFTSPPLSSCTYPHVLLEEVWVCCLSILAQEKFSKIEHVYFNTLSPLIFLVRNHLQGYGILEKLNFFLK